MGVSTSSTQTPRVSVETSIDKADYLLQLSKLSPDTLSILADLARRPGVEAKLKANAKTLKLLI